MRRTVFPLTLVVVALLAITARGEAFTSHADRVSAAQAFTKRTLRFKRQLAGANHHALAVLTRRRGAAAGCLPVWQSAPLTRRDRLSLIYFEYLSGALWAVDGPIYRSWVTDLRSSTAVARFPRLKVTARSLVKEYLAANTAYTSFPDVCATVTAWQNAGWSDDAAPPQLRALDALKTIHDPLIGKPLQSTADQLRRYAKRGDDAVQVLLKGIDEPDSRVLGTTCDDVGALVDPRHYDACGQR